MLIAVVLLVAQHANVPVPYDKDPRDVIVATTWPDGSLFVRSLRDGAARAGEHMSHGVFVFGRLEIPQIFERDHGIEIISATATSYTHDPKHPSELWRHPIQFDVEADTFVDARNGTISVGKKDETGRLVPVYVFINPSGAFGRVGDTTEWIKADDRDCRISLYLVVVYKVGGVEHTTKTGMQLMEGKCVDP